MEGQKIAGKYEKEDGNIPLPFHVVAVGDVDKAPEQSSPSVSEALHTLAEGKTKNKGKHLQPIQISSQKSSILYPCSYKL